MDSTHIAPLDYFSMIRRRRWLWITPILASALVGWLLVKYLPREYKSSTTIGVTAALVSPSLISQTTPFDNQERMRAIQQQLLSVPILARVARAEGASESQVTRRMTQLRNAISITVPDPVAATNEPRRLDTFVINYTDAEPELAQRIANRLASVFVEENSKVRTERANDTTAFIDAQLAASQVRMTELETRLRRSKEALRRPAAGTDAGEPADPRRPEAADRRRTPHPHAVSAIGCRVIERQIDAIDRNTVDEPGNVRPAEGVLSAEARVSTLERDLAAAQATYTDRHPDVQRLQEELASAPPRRAGRASAAGGRSPGPPASATPRISSSSASANWHGPGSRISIGTGQETQLLIKALPGARRSVADGRAAAVDHRARLRARAAAIHRPVVQTARRHHLRERRARSERRTVRRCSSPRRSRPNRSSPSRCASCSARFSPVCASAPP